ncbi:MAG: hypothetical protein Q7N50_10735 [Armatimonadota bacterium]|nr:hypothetical protein [Armatimonadota bacterium]
MVGFFQALGRFVVRLFLGLARAIGQVLLALARGFGDTVLHALRGAGHAIGRLVGRMLPWAAGAGGTYWLYVYQPNVLAALLQLGVVIFAFWLMVKRVFRAPNRGERRRR